MPLLAQPAWLALMGYARVEQQRLQLAKNKPSPEALAIIRRKHRKAARLAELRELRAEIQATR